MKSKIVVVLIIAAVVASIFIFDLQTYLLNPDLLFQELKQQQQKIQSLYAENPILFPAIFFVLYVIGASLALPTSGILSLAAGAIFGVVFGSILVSFASSIGATIAFLLTRFLFRDAVQNKFGDKLSVINRGVEKEGAFYVFTIRLIVVFPFFVVNSLLALTPVKTRTFYWASQIGMLPATIIFVNAGTQLATLESPSGILSPNILLSFGLLFASSWIFKFIVDKMRARRSQQSQVDS